ncbi:Uncharacterised protein [Serratia marcescens]|uniref:hypothetical protein n=1 Tax=Serratia marcescens TaxID=615 RepID=UPI0007451EBB|nr:hypothetical protein [Serratia marcescens]CUZ08633.1 Uncharacterised protein [Serratia marcescens]CUZ34425.1 Uncharacterised protein [Serratia marcescens]CUZ34924.1 Uncharacterised protein [Serratia marcescens]CUZ36244.1 Uncharacterised protein [Serratia marcescens]CVA66040.1 Uncharacterised protein [Serratia marcescens]
MKERPVIFNGEMVRAILDGRKTQTRRVIANVSLDNCIPLQKPTKTKDGIYTHVMDAPGNGLCPFGQIGDRLWVRETFAILGNEDGCPIDWDGNLIKGDEKHAARIYKASCWQEPGNYGLWSIPDRDTQYEGAWRPSIHMPRWASRITLEITAVRVERLNDISEEDAKAEGVRALENNFGNGPAYCDYLLPNLDDAAEWYNRASDSFKSLWKSIYGAESWRANPWVWVIEFKQVSEESQHG